MLSKVNWLRVFLITLVAILLLATAIISWHIGYNQGFTDDLKFWENVLGIPGKVKSA